MLIVDSLHTAVDGVVLGASFVASPSTGLLAALATAVHEIPQEIGDFSIMIRAKMKAKKIAKLQIISSLILVPAAMVAYFAGNIIEPHLPVLMALIAGFFLYIALGEICSIIKRAKDHKKGS
jgi:zinc and cadmium transporter